MTTDSTSAPTIPAPSVSNPAVASATSNTDKLADENTFLKLLVAQLEYQNPLSPADGIQFITQLAQFTSLEYSATMRDDLDAIRKNMTAQGTSGTGASGTGGQDPASGSTDPASGKDSSAGAQDPGSSAGGQS